jgi:hypothetical protein
MQKIIPGFEFRSDIQKKFHRLIALEFNVFFNIVPNVKVCVRRTDWGLAKMRGSGNSRKSENEYEQT